MNIIHSTYGIERALSILKEGIRPPRNHSEKFNTDCGFTDKVFLSVLIDSCKTSAWGDYHFQISEDYFSKSRDQFRVHAPSSSNKYFFEFVKRFGIKPYEGRDCQLVPNQIISLEPIPVKGLAKLITPKDLTPEEIQAIRDIIPLHMELEISKLLNLSFL